LGDERSKGEGELDFGKLIWGNKRLIVLKKEALNAEEKIKRGGQTYKP